MNRVEIKKKSAAFITAAQRTRQTRHRRHSRRMDARLKHFFSIGRPLHCDCLICMFSPSDDLYNVLPPLVRPYNSAISTHGRCHGNRPCSSDFGERDGRRFELTDLIKLF